MDIDILLANCLTGPGPKPLSRDPGEPVAALLIRLAIAFGLFAAVLAGLDSLALGWPALSEA